MTRARHRLFDAKRRDGWHTYMQGAELRRQYRASVPPSACAVYTNRWVRLGTLEELGVGFN